MKLVHNFRAMYIAIFFLVGLSTQHLQAQLSVSPTSLNIPASGASGQIMINANAVWIASADMSWIALSPIQGINNGSTSYTIAANTAVNARTGSITIIAGGTTQTVIAVSQAGVPATILFPFG